MGDTLPSTRVDAKRESVLDHLSSCYAKDFLSMDEYETRAMAATNARTLEDLDALTVDLPAAVDAADGKKPKMRARADTEFDERRIAAPGSSRRHSLTISLFSGSNKRGQWKPARTMTVISVFGGASLDFRQAILPPEGVSVHVISVFGGTGIVVPPDVGVHTGGLGVFGGFGGPHDRDGLPGAPEIRVSGLAVFGGAGVTVRK